MGRIKDLNSALPTENDAFVFDGANGTKRLSYAEFKQKLIDDGFGSGSSEAVVLTQAEYDALPDEVKDSDTIFFISDAPFENSNVVTLTRAQYDALSDATKMDGRFYYITDETEVTKSLVVQNNVNSTETVPSSAVVYGLKSDTDSQITDLNNSLNNLDPMVIVDEAITIQNTTKTYTVPYFGLYLILARTNANTDSVKPSIRIDDASGVYAQNIGSAGGSVSVHKVTIVRANSTVTLAANNNIVASKNYSGYGRFTMILLKKMEAW